MLNIRSEPLGMHNLGELNQIYRRVYGKFPPEDHFRNKYRPGAAPAVAAGFVIYIGDSAAGFCGVFKHWVKYRDCIESSGQMADLMVIPEFRRLGLATLLLQNCEQWAENEGLRFLWFFGNQSTRFLITGSSGWELLHRMNMYSFRVNGRVAALLLRMAGRIFRQSRIPCESFRVKSPAVFHSFEGSDRAHTLRTEMPEANKMAGGSFMAKVGRSLLFLKQSGDLFIGDALPAVDDDIAEIIRQLSRDALKNGASKIIFQSSPGSDTERLFARYSIAVPTFYIGYRNLGSAIPQQALAFTWCDMDSF